MSSLEYMAGFSENTCGIDTITEDVYEENGSTIASGLDSIPFDHKQGKEVFLCPTSEDEVANVQCLLAEPQNEKLLEVDARALKMEDEVAFGDFAYSLDCYDYVYEAYNGKMHSEILYSDLLQNGGHETHIDFADSVFQGIEDETLDKNLCMPEHLAHAGSIFTGKSSCYESNIECHLQSFDFECPPQSVRKEHQGSDNPVKQISMVPKAEFSVDADGKSVPFLDDMGICELHQVFRSTFGQDTFINDKEWLKRWILFCFGDDKFNSDPFRLKGGLCSMEDDGGFAFSNDLSFPKMLSDIIVDNCD